MTARRHFEYVGDLEDEVESLLTLILPKKKKTQTNKDKNRQTSKTTTSAGGLADWKVTGWASNEEYIFFDHLPVTLVDLNLE